MIHKKLMLGASLFAATSLAACGLFDRDLTDEKLKRICETYCKSDKPAAYVPIVTKWETDSSLPGGGKVTQSPGSIWVQGVDGFYEHPYKAAKLNPDCFSDEPLDVKDKNGIPKLEKLNLTADNTTIRFLNFTRGGALESRTLSDLKGSQAADVKSDIDIILNTNTSGTTSEYEQVRNILTNLQGAGFSGRPPAGAIDNRGFSKRDIIPVQDEKTPFFERVGDPGGANSREHAFFYVLLDSRLKFDREGPGMIPYGPAAQNDVGHLYTPYIQYDIYPLKLDTQADRDKVEVMPVHFLRENMAKEIPVKGENAKCSYPYDIGVISEGQLSVGEPDTPLLVDPETETDGPPIQ